MVICNSNKSIYVCIYLLVPVPYTKIVKVKVKVFEVIEFKHFRFIYIDYSVEACYKLHFYCYF